MIINDEINFQNYLLAEIILNVAVELKPENVYSQRELMRVKVSQIENMGYSKRDALLSLEKHSTVSVILSSVSIKIKNLFNIDL